MICHNIHTADKQILVHDPVEEFCHSTHYFARRGCVTVEVDGPVRLFGNLPSVGVFLNRAVILCPSCRIGQVLNVVANCENHLVGDKPLVHQIQNEQVRHLADDELRFICLIGAVQNLTGAEAVGAGTVCLDCLNGRRLPAPRMINE